MIKPLSILSILVLSSTLAFAKHDKFHGGGGGLLHPKDFKELNLTKEQKEKVKGIKESSKDKAKALHKEVKEAGQNLKALMASQASKEEVTKAFETFQGKMKEMAQLRFSQVLEIRDILTPEQKAKLKDLIDKRKADRSDDDEG